MINERRRKNAVNDLINVLKSKMYSDVSQLDATVYLTKEPVVYSNRTTGKMKKVNVGEQWGELWDCGWFCFKGTVPEDICMKELYFEVDVAGEGLLFDKNGNPLQGITTFASGFETSLGHPGKKYINLAAVKDALGLENGKEFEIWFDCGCNDLFGVFVDRGTLRSASIVKINNKLHKAYYDYFYLNNLADNMYDVSYKKRIDRDLYDASLIIRDGAYSDESIDEADKVIGKYLNVEGKSELDFFVSAVGHAHMDLAWLWPIRETKRKTARTYATVLKNMEKYPDYVFGISQPQIFEWLEVDYPDLYEKLKAKIAEGRIECQGGMWVEADTNVSGAEALARQFLYGKKYYKEKFGKEMKMLWLPDVFGYTAALPQIMKQADVDYFMTIKLSWSEDNRFPYHSFHWKGIDGSSVIAHMPPEGTYNSGARPESVRRIIDNYAEKDVSDEALIVFGIGDGGGGPGEEHLENLTRFSKSARFANVKQQPAQKFFDRLSEKQDKLPEWSGELYLEKHQGTLTTHARNKRWNRKTELALREWEFAAALAWRLCGFEYPAEEIEKAWKEVLLYQFHDILPGSSIKRVYKESQERYEEIYKEACEGIEKAYGVLSSKVSGGQKGVLFNSLSWARKKRVALDSGHKAVEVPALGWAAVSESNGKEGCCCCSGAKEETAQNVLENKFVKIEFGSNGEIVSYFDKEANRELVDKEMPLHNYTMYDDSGDCWDMQALYRERKPSKLNLVSMEKYSEGNRSGMKLNYAFGETKVEVDASLCGGGKMLRFSCKADWQEKGKMLRVEFPLTEIKTTEATCDIQFGNITRNTHTNTTWEMAKYEVPAQKWIDVSETGYGVAILNDCKYGFHIHHNIIDINLLRSPGYPSTEEDGLHEFSYAIYPHDGSLAQSDVVKQGYFFNNSVYEAKPASANTAEFASVMSVLSADKENIVVEAVKRAEDGNGLIVRFYEALGIDTTVNFDMGCLKGDKVYRTNIMERDKEQICSENGEFVMNVKPFEIVSLRICK